MNKKQKKITLILITVPLVSSLIIRPQNIPLHLSNAYFYLSAPFLLIGLFGVILKDGTFDFFYASFKRWQTSLNPKEQKNTDLQTNFNDEELHELSSLIGNKHLFLLKMGSILLLMSIIWVIYYTLIS